MRRTAAEIAARYPAISPDELARASAIVAPQIQELAAQSANVGANFPAGGDALRGLLANGFASISLLGSILCGLISVLAVPGGLVTRALGHAVVSRDGREIWPGAIGDAVPGRLVSGARVDRLCRSPDVRRAASVSGRGGCRGQSRVLNDGGRRHVDHRESRARTT